MTAFALHPRLDGDTHFVTDLALCRVLLMDDRRFPWVILVPRVTDACEVHDLTPAERTQLMAETSTLSAVMTDLFAPDKINIGALGNLVAQLHVHVVARNRGDAAWPGPVWGHGAAVAYEGEDAGLLIARLDAVLK